MVPFPEHELIKKLVHALLEGIWYFYEILTKADVCIFPFTFTYNLILISVNITPFHDNGLVKKLVHDQV